MGRIKMRFFTILLTVIFVFSLSPAYTSNAFAEMEVFGDNNEFSWCYVDTGNFYVSGDGDLTLKDDGSLYWHYTNECIKVLFVEEGITSIADYVFANSTNLTTVYLYDTLTSIGPYAFSNCDALTDVYFDGTHEQYVSISGYDQVFADSVTIHYLKPSISKHPSDYTGIVGSTATFSVTAWGEGLKYQWQYYSGGKWNNFGSNRSSVSLTVSNAHNGMKYRCIVTDEFDNTVTSSVATIHIIKPVSITTQPKDYTGLVGSKAAFSVVAQGTGLKYQWQYYSGGKWNDFGSNKATASVTVSNSHNGMKYRCIVKDSYGNTATSNTATIHVIKPVSITTHPKDYTGAAGSKATFSVVAQGTGLSYQWQYYSGGTWKNFGSNRSSVSLTVSNAHNGMKYRCVVTDANGNTATSNAATIHVTAPISITTQPKEYTFSAGSRVTLSLSAQGTGLSYQWQYYSGGTWKNFGSNKSTVTITVTNAHNGMKYRCIVTDTTGNTVTVDVATIKIV